MERAELQGMRRLADALDGVRGRTIEGCTLRTDRKQLKLELGDGMLLVVGLDLDDQGRPRLMVHVTRPSDSTTQLEVPFGAGR
jgi:hypothetical protein